MEIAELVKVLWTVFGGNMESMAPEFVISGIGI